MNKQLRWRQTRAGLKFDKPLRSTVTRHGYMQGAVFLLMRGNPDQPRNNINYFVHVIMQFIDKASLKPINIDDELHGRTRVDFNNPCIDNANNGLIIS
jgi:hypothetical protein